MKLTSTSFEDGQRIPAEYAFCAPDPTSHAKLSHNRNPQIAWSDVPMGTKSLVLIAHDYAMWFASDADYERRLLRVRRPVPAVERFDRASLCVHAVCALRLRSLSRAGCWLRGRRAKPAAGVS